MASYGMKPIVRSHRLTFAILLFLISFFIVHTIKPAFVYTPDGAFRDFGVGYKNKTVLPIWIVCIVLAILSYLAIISYLFYF